MTRGVSQAGRVGNDAKHPDEQDNAEITSSSALLPIKFVSLTVPQTFQNIPPRPEFTPFEVRHLCKSKPFDGEDFWTYPERCGWIVHAKDMHCHVLCPPGTCFHDTNPDKIHMRSPMFSRSDGRPVLASDRAAFLQAWLFFGVLTEVSNLCGLQIDIAAEFIVDNGSFSTAGLNGLPRRWFEAAIRTGRAGDKMLMERILAVARHSYLMLSEETVAGKKISMFEYTYEECRVLSSLQIVIRVIGLHLLLHIYMPGFSSTEEEGWSKNRVTKNLDFSPSFETEGFDQLSDLAQDSLEHQGWCKSELDLLAAPFHLAFASLLSRPRIRDHSNCGDIICSAYQTDEATYETRHVEGECSCDFVGVETGVLVAALSEDKIPKVVITEDLDFQVVSGHDYPYIALSHVWADGLGNPVSNALPRCQLQRLRDYANHLSRVLNPTSSLSLPVAFWMDTLCIPVDPTAKAYRKRAIQLLGKTFHEAIAVLILDRELEIVNSTTASFLELGMRIICSGWVKRLWTLQEATLASEARGAVELYFQMQDGPFMYQKYDRDRTVNGRTTEVESEERELLEEYGVMLILGEQIPSVRAMRTMRKGWSPFEVIRSAIERRSTSKFEDVPVCIASLLGKDSNAIVSASGAEQRMAQFYRLMREVPTGILWEENVERLSISPFRWAPKLITGCPISAYAAWEDGTCDEAGLHIQIRGFVFEKNQGEKVHGIVVPPISNIASVENGHIHGQLYSYWPQSREYERQIPLPQTWGMLFRPANKRKQAAPFEPEPNVVAVEIQDTVELSGEDKSEIICRIIGYMGFAAGPHDATYPVLSGFAKTADQRWCIT
ncbi:hypothetical protein K435DRAFT_841561 [Dendrothele bispora CBS 962.96]|uniref:Heterokaryon incompatibility domain-containing protein n=1 Tax=Dendrothele bispora (strain CBS 962.96) TaxID=1314807 RepID=A0A4S8LLP4_DENBC|nr:hypothetical protein K435DRAFT_841561 [Dendrothele bispora CBS 962.96]